MGDLQGALECFKSRNSTSLAWKRRKENDGWLLNLQYFISRIIGWWHYSAIDIVCYLWKGTNDSEDEVKSPWQSCDFKEWICEHHKIIARPWWQKSVCPTTSENCLGPVTVFSLYFSSFWMWIFITTILCLSLYFWTENLIFEFQRFANEDELCFPRGSDGKESACKEGDPGSIPGLGRSPGEGNGYPLQYLA